MSTVTLVPAQSPEKRHQRRSGAFLARRMLWAESSIDRVRRCGNSLNGQCSDRVGVKLSDGVAGFSGLQTCGSPWSCPVCAQKIMATRADDVQSAVAGWHSSGGRVVFLTLTMRHRLGQRLADLWDALSYGWSKVTSGRAWERDCETVGEWLPREVKGETRYGHRINFVKAVEVTHGKNGWHVHIHALLFVRDGITSEQITALSDSVYGRWAKALQRKGLTSPTPANGIDTRLVDRGDSKALGDYFTKNIYVGRVREDAAGWEIAGGQGKFGRSKNRTPFQILADVVEHGDADDLALWWEWEAASSGRRQITWSRGLRALFLTGEELTDQEAAEAELGGDVVMFFSREEWRWLRWRSCRVLQLVEAGKDRQEILTELAATEKPTVWETNRYTE